MKRRHATLEEVMFIFKSRFARVMPAVPDSHILINHNENVISVMVEDWSSLLPRVSGVFWSEV